MSDPTIPTMDALVDLGAAAYRRCDPNDDPPVFTARAILTAVLPLVTGPAGEALDGIIDSLAEQDDEGLIEHAEPFRRARTTRDQLAALAKEIGT